MSADDLNFPYEPIPGGLDLPMLTDDRMAALRPLVSAAIHDAREAAKREGRTS